MLPKFSEDDLKMHRALKSVISQADYRVKGDAISTVNMLLSWYNSLEQKMVASIQEAKKSGSPKIEKIKDK